MKRFQSRARALVGFGLTIAAFAALAHEGNQPAPDFGPNVTIIDPSMTTAEINSLIAPVAGNPHRQIYFMPGTYGSAAGADNPATATDIINATLNANTAIAGLGASPEDVRINGALHVEGFGSALGTFARSLSNMDINPIQPGEAAHTMRWLTSQTCPWRRVHLEGNADLNTSPGIFAFGNEFANVVIDGILTPGNGQNTATSQGGQTQAMFFVHDSEIGGLTGYSSIFEFSGVKGAPPTRFAAGVPGDTVNVPRTPVSRDAPYLFVKNGRYMVFAPFVRFQSLGSHWGQDWGRTLDLSTFYIAHPGTDTAETMNEALAKGKNLLLTPGAYSLEDTLVINRPDTVVMGLGFATLTPTSGTAAVEVGDVPGVLLSGFSVNAGPVNSDVLIQIGTPRGRRGNPIDPTSLTDVHISVGNPSSATTSEIINQDYVLVDQTWIRRGGNGWTTSLAKHGLIVNGDHVTILGIWLEHYQQTQLLWNGDDGRLIFLESEAPYDPPNQAAWMNGSKDGYPILKVDPSVRLFEANGFGAYEFFMPPASCDCFLSSAIEAPVSPGVRFKNITAGTIIGSHGGFQNVINNDGLLLNADLFLFTSVFPNSDVFGFTVNTRISASPSGGWWSW